MKAMIFILLTSLVAIGFLVLGASDPIIEMVLEGKLLLAKLSLGLVAVSTAAIVTLGIKTMLEWNAKSAKKVGNE